MNAQRTAGAETPTFPLKHLSKEAVPSALSKAEHYRLLNQPYLAESICIDILNAEPDHQKAKTVLLLALSDQFDHKPHKARRALELAHSLTDAYSRQYYAGIIHERQGNAALQSSTPGSDFDAYEWYREAMEFYELADEVNPSSNEDVVLRWNTCARIIMENQLHQRPLDDFGSLLE